MESRPFGSSEARRQSCADHPGAQVLCAAFVAVAFMSGVKGQLYQQFALTIAVAVILGDQRTHAFLAESVFAKGAPSVPAYVPWAGRKNHAILGLPHGSCFR
jgi:hypothetical protein